MCDASDKWAGGTWAAEDRGETGGEKVGREEEELEHRREGERLKRLLGEGQRDGRAAATRRERKRNGGREEGGAGGGAEEGERTVT